MDLHLEPKPEIKIPNSKPSSPNAVAVKHRPGPRTRASASSRAFLASSRASAASIPRLSTALAIFNTSAFNCRGLRGSSGSEVWAWADLGGPSGFEKMALGMRLFTHIAGLPGSCRHRCPCPSSSSSPSLAKTSINHMETPSDHLDSFSSPSPLG